MHESFVRPKYVELIASYSRAQAIADGQLIDISVLARIAGFKLHTVITAAADAELVRADAVVSVLASARRKALAAGDTDLTSR